MAALELCTATDVLRRIGGTAAATQICPDGADPSTYDANVMTLAIQDASNAVCMAAKVQTVLSGLTQAEYQARFPELVTLAAQKAPYLFWLYGTHGQACPERVTVLNAAADVELERLRQRKSAYGAVDFDPTPNQQVAQVDNDPNQTRGLGSLSSWSRGFC